MHQTSGQSQETLKGIFQTTKQQQPKQIQREYDENTEEVISKGIDDFNDSRNPAKFKDNEALKELIKYNELEVEIAVHKKLLEEDCTIPFIARY